MVITCRGLLARKCKKSRSKLNKEKERYKEKKLERENVIYILLIIGIIYLAAVAES